MGREKKKTNKSRSKRTELSVKVRSAKWVEEHKAS